MKTIIFGSDNECDRVFFTKECAWLSVDAWYGFCKKVTDYCWHTAGFSCCMTMMMVITQ